MREWLKNIKKMLKEKNIKNNFIGGLMEFWDVYDKNRVNTNEIIERGAKFDDNQFHLVVHACIFNSQGKMLIQQRQPFKNGWANLWDLTVGGSAVAGETSELAVKREVLEEIGYDLKLNGRRPSISVNFDFGFDDFYIINEDIDIQNLTLQEEEVQAVKWASKEEIIEMINDGSFIPYYESLVHVLFDMRNYYGSHRDRNIK